MKAVKGFMVTLALGTVSVLAAVGILVWQNSATAQFSAAGKAVPGAPDTQKKIEKSATTPDRQNPPEGKIVSGIKAREIREKLDSPVTIEFEAGTPLIEALNHISERYKLTILIDNGAFGADQGEMDIEHKPVKLQKLLDVRLRTALGAILQQLNAEFYAKDEALLVLPRGRIASGALLQEPVDVAFDKRPLADALKELADMTGVSIVLDAEKAPNPKVELTADFHHVPLECAVRVLADMAGMKSITMANMVYVTAPGNAETLLQELNRKDNPRMHKIENPTSKEKP